MFCLGKFIFLSSILILNISSDIETEKSRQVILESVENYDKTSLKPTDTQEKILLPAKEGIHLLKLILYKISFPS